MLRRKRNPKGCKKAQKEPQMPCNRASIVLQKSLTYHPTKPQLRFTLGLIERYVRLFWTASKALLKQEKHAKE